MFSKLFLNKSWNNCPIPNVWFFFLIFLVLLLSQAKWQMNVLLPLSFPKIHSNNFFERFLRSPKMHLSNQLYFHFKWFFMRCATDDHITWFPLVLDHVEWETGINGLLQGQITVQIHGIIFCGIAYPTPPPQTQDHSSIKLISHVRVAHLYV